MRRPFSVTHPVNPETARNSRIRLLQKLSELGWFNEGSDQLLTERCSRNRQLLTGIHKETPMFYTVFQGNRDITVRLYPVLVGFLAGIAVKQRKSTVSRTK